MKQLNKTVSVIGGLMLGMSCPIFADNPYVGYISSDTRTGMVQPNASTNPYTLMSANGNAGDDDYSNINQTTTAPPTPTGPVTAPKPAVLPAAPSVSQPPVAPTPPAPVPLPLGSTTLLPSNNAVFSSGLNANTPPKNMPPQAPSSSSEKGLSPQVAQQFLLTGSGFSQMQQMRVGIDRFMPRPNPKKIVEDVQEEQMNYNSKAMQFAFANMQSFLAPAQGSSVSPQDTFQAAVQAPFLDPTWLNTLNKASEVQVLRIIAAQNALNAQLQLAILQRLTEVELLQANTDGLTAEQLQAARSMNSRSVGLQQDLITKIELLTDTLQRQSQAKH
jgi:hypothetical protein